MSTLEPFFNPSGVAVIGASANPDKLGFGIVRNLINYGFPRPVYPVNPRATEILGRQCYPEIEQVPEPCDLAIIILPARLVNEAVASCGRRRIKQVIIASGGFGEIGTEGAEHERAIAATAREHGIRIIGPNCIGTIDTRSALNTTFIAGRPAIGNIGFISQSGAICAAFIEWTERNGVGFSRIASLGNQVDVNEADMLAELAKDSNTLVIAAYIEGVSDGEAFIAAAEGAAQTKPLVVLKGGRGDAGARAVVSHTGALAGNAVAVQAAFDHCGILQARTMEDLLDWARALAWQPLPNGDRVAILTNAGGPGILAVDAIEARGLRLASLESKTLRLLKELLPPVASVKNPVDILAGSGPDLYAGALDILLSDNAVDAVVVIQAPQDWFLPEDLAREIVKVMKRHQKPIVTAIMGVPPGGEATAILQSGKIPNVDFSERAANTLSALVRRRQWLDRPAEIYSPIANVDKDAARTAMTSGDFAAAVTAYGIPLAQEQLVTNEDAAVRAAETIGFPVALKLVSPDIIHKTDHDAIRLNLVTPTDVVLAFRNLFTSTRDKNPKTKIDGVLVQKMITQGQELIIGSRRDPQFGPLLIVGTGGIEVELKQDIATGLAPMSPDRASRLLDRTKAGLRILGWRGSPAGDRQAVIDAMIRLGQLADDFPELQEIEVNPLIVLAEGSGVVAIDVRGSFKKPKT